MSVITALTPQVKDKNRVNVYIDGDFVCGLQLETAVKYNLKAGVSLTRERLAEIEFDSEKTKALEKASAYISKTMKTEKQLIDYLAGKGYGIAVISFIIEKFKQYGYVDDKEYAAAYIRSVGGKKGERLIRYELRGKGVSDEDIDSAFSENRTDEDAVFAVADKFMRRKEATPENVKKLYRHLVSKGFSYEDAGRAAERFKE